MWDDQSGLVSIINSYAPPNKIKLKEIPGGMQITNRWAFQISDVVLGLLALSLIIHALQLLFSGHPLSESEGGTAFFLLLACPFMFYRSLVTIFNSTWISVVEGEIIIQKGPFPWFPKLVLSVDEIAQVSYSKPVERVRFTKIISYQVNAAFQDGSERALDICHKEDQAKFLYQELNSFLDI